MDYLKKYNLSEEDILEIYNEIDHMDKLELKLNQKRVEKVIEYLLESGIKNIKSILKYKTNIFYNKVDVIKYAMEKNPNIVDLINEDVVNFELIGL